MSTADVVFDDKLLSKIQTILHLCSVHRASISFRSKVSDANPTRAKNGQILVWETRVGALQPTLVGRPADTMFHIASITKILVGIAVAHAIEVKAEETVVDNPWSKFKDIRGMPIRDVYNTNKNPADRELGLIVGNPTVYEFLVHSLGLPSCNDHIFAPDGTPLLHLEELLGHVPEVFQSEQAGDGSRWTSYSNLNFAVIALMIESCWGGRLADFMEKTLFTPLNMHSTSIGLPSNRTKPSERWTVDQHGARRPVQIPDYEATGAEAAALGAYSTSEDLDKFFSSVMDAAQGIDPNTLQGFSRTVDKLLRMENKYIDDVMHYTPFGLATKLNGSTIGALSTSGLQFPHEPFTRYPTIPGTLGEEYIVHYMAGSAIGSSCATALRIDTPLDFALTVLTDTSGPVAVADHILRLVLQRWVDTQKKGSIRRLLSTRRDSVKRMVIEGKNHAIENWKRKEQVEQRMRETACAEPFSIQGVYNGVGIPQKLQVVKRSDGKLECAVGGAASVAGGRPPMSGFFELLWENSTRLWLCIPPHASIDRLDHGDWSDLRFNVSREANGTVELRRNRKNGTEVRYIRQT